MPSRRSDFKGGQTHAQHFMPELLDRISRGELHPETIITHTLPLEAAARGYRIFNEKQEDFRKVVLRPQTQTLATK
jgi:threonine dehydrogenase-like Zn-dependent dehydrogenase